MHSTGRHVGNVLGVTLALAGVLEAQQWNDPQGRTLSGLRTVAVHARVQSVEHATLQKLDEARLRTRLVRAMRQEGISVQDGGDVRDGSAAQISLVYLVLPIADEAGRKAGFAASSCLHASQYVRIPRLEAGGRITYTVAPTWSSCGLIVGDTDSYGERMLQNADEQIARFLRAWRSVNPSRRDPPVHATPELGLRTSQ
jgi:hypothetical protein